MASLMCLGPCCLLAAGWSVSFLIRVTSFSPLPALHSVASAELSYLVTAKAEAAGPSKAEFKPSQWLALCPTSSFGSEQVTGPAP